jgi:hypothetical protein
MGVRERDARDSAAAPGFRGDPFDVFRIAGAGIDHPRRLADDPCVRARERHRSRVARAHEGHAGRHAFCDLGHVAQYG